MRVREIARAFTLLLPIGVLTLLGFRDTQKSSAPVAQNTAICTDGESSQASQSSDRPLFVSCGGFF